MQPHFLNRNLYSSFSHDLSKIQKFSKSLSLANGGRVLFLQSVSFLKTRDTLIQWRLKYYTNECFYPNSVWLIFLKMYTQIPYADLCNNPKFQFHCCFTPEFWLSAPWGSSEINLRPNFELFSITLTRRCDCQLCKTQLVPSAFSWEARTMITRLLRDLESIRVIVIWRCYLRDVLDDSDNISLFSRKN